MPLNVCDKKGMIINMKILRRSIILVCLVLLLSSIPMGVWPSNKYLDPTLKDKINNKQATVIELNNKGTFDGHSFTAERIITTSDKTYLRYRLISDGRGWSFAGSITIYDDNHKKYDGFNTNSEGKIWGTEGLTVFDKLPENTKEITVVVQCYDRKLELKIPLDKAGEKK